MGFFDKLTGRGAKAAAAPSIEGGVKDWVDAIFQQLQPDRLKIQAGETIADAFSRIMAAEEQKVRNSGEAEAHKQLKLEALANMRQQLSLPVTGTVSRETSMKEQEQSPHQATYEMVLGRAEDLKDAPLAYFMQLVQGWSSVVDSVARAERLSDAKAEEYKSVSVTISQEGSEPELVAWFRGSSDMVSVFRAKLRELGIESPE